MTTITLFLLTCFTCSTACATLLWQRLQSPGADWFLLLYVTIWVGIGATFVLAASPASAAIMHAAIVLTPAVFYCATLEYFGAHSASSRWLQRAMLALGVVLSALAGTNSLHGIYAEFSAGGALLTHGPGSLAALCYAYLGVGLTMTVALKNRTTSEQPPRLFVFVGLPVALLATSLVALVLDWQVRGTSPVLLGVALASALSGLLLYRNGRSKVDVLARDMLFQQHGEPVVVLDAQRGVVDCNEAFAALVDSPRPELPGTALPDLLTEANAKQLLESNGGEYLMEWQLPEDGGVAHYQVQSTPLPASRGPAGRLLVMSEQSSRLHSERALESADIALEHANISLDRLSLHDDLTGLANQRYFIDELEKEVARHQRSERRFGVIAIEADHFHLLAEQHGAALRDRALALIARAIEVEVRGTDLCARLEGDEFVVLAVQMKVPGLVSLAERIRKRVLKVRPLTPGGERVRMSVSCGVGIFDPKQDDLRRLLARTNRYLSEAKRSGRNKVVSGD